MSCSLKKHVTRNVSSVPPAPQGFDLVNGTLTRNRRPKEPCSQPLPRHRNQTQLLSTCHTSLQPLCWAHRRHKTTSLLSTLIQTFCVIPEIGPNRSELLPSPAATCSPLAQVGLYFPGAMVSTPTRLPTNLDNIQNPSNMNKSL